ncbi:protein phosphatase 1 regulatory subunit 15B isoform X2 [Sphaeramia orbicularis]|uniref:protein phosphatase 1 regulatory subunit 15B isoform X2 n=1 Tax=Sphaeramia orbicularis TaxID=375764 RepID=UPI00117C0FA9|nr:protein phosphatase 1 regulatory subunit 15B-like isoform X2 [Sphaeramia orbicularis]
MFRNITGEGQLSGGQSTASPRGNGITSPGLDSQESSWIGLLSVVSRPALSFLQKYLPGRARNPAAQSDNAVGWIRGDVKKTFIEEENEFLRQLDDMMPAPHLTYLQCQHEGAAGSSGLPWLTAESLREMGIQDPEEVNLNLGYISSARTVLSHVLLSSVSSQEMKGVKAGSKGRPWWGSLWGGEEENPQGKPLSDLSWTVTGLLCPQRPGSETKASAVFVQNEEREWTVGENAGPAHHKEEPANNGGLHTVQNSGKSAADHQLSITHHLSSSEGAAAACPVVTLLSPDQDNGYSSLEEEQFQICQLHMMKAPAPINKQLQVEAAVGSPESSSTGGTDMEEETPEEEEEEEVDEEEIQKDDDEAQELSSAAAIVTPKCQNKTIAFIMGCPCSDDDSSQSEFSEDDGDDDDDGFDSEGSSDLSNSSDEDDEDDEDSEIDSEAERLWNSLCHSQDPYNPRNFTARMHTGPPTLPRTIPIPSAAAAATTPPSSASSSPASPPALPAPSPQSGSDSWDDSASASEADEGESLRLWSSFSSSLDPYSPLNFQASLRTQSPRTRAKKAPQAPIQNLASPPKYRKEEAEERLDSGFSEPSTSTSSRSTKKVHFCDDVEEFFASCSEEEEDRKGPWEELARDRCRFLRRCQEVEQSIAFCLQPQHRSKVYRRLQQCPDQHA